MKDHSVFHIIIHFNNDEIRFPIHVYGSNRISANKQLIITYITDILCNNSYLNVSSDNLTETVNLHKVISRYIIYNIGQHILSRLRPFTQYIAVTVSKSLLVPT